MLEWRNILKGMTMGISDLIPGVSGGTIALVLGIYQPLIAGINGLFTKEWKKHLVFLLPLVIGIVVALLTVSRVIEWLLVTFPQPTFFFFLGLIIGIIPTLLKSIDFKKSFKQKHYFLLVVGAILVAATVFVKDNELPTVMNHLSWSEYVLLFFAGWMASSAMILPGISGSFIFLLLGVYPTVIHALSTFNLAIIMAVGSGIAIGLVLTSRLITYLLAQYKIGTYAVMIGFILGSIVVIYPGMESNLNLFVISILALGVGWITAYLLAYVELKRTVAKLNI